MVVGRIKKKRYGIKTMSKEENLRLKEMSKRKIMLAKARGNLWKLSRNPQCMMEEKKEEAWRVIGEGAMELTGEEDWERGYKVDIGGLLARGLLRKPMLEIQKESGDVQPKPDVQQSALLDAQPFVKTLSPHGHKHAQPVQPDQ